MANARSLPVAFLKDPDVIALSGADTRLILIGLLLGADDHGRGFAHSTLLGREICGYSPEVVEQALQELASLDLIQLYQGGRHRYYWLPRWQEWEKLREPARSKFPPPPEATPPQEACVEGQPEHVVTASPRSVSSPDISARNFGNPQETSGIAGNPQKDSQEDEGEDEGEDEDEKEKEDEGEGETPGNVVPFPPSRIGTADAVFSPSEVIEGTQQIAAILKLNPTNALTRVVQEYGQDRTLSLFGEADAAREWIDNPRRNHKRQAMSVAFFRRWLKREQEAVAQRQTARTQTPATGTTDGRARAPAPSMSLSTQEEEDPYRAFLQRRVSEVQQQYSQQHTGGSS